MKMLKKGLPCILTLFLLTALLTGCPDEGNDSGNGPKTGTLFSSSFNSVLGNSAKLELRTISGARSARALASGLELIAVIEDGDKLLRLEGFYDPTDGRFNLSAKSGDEVYTVIGMLDDKNEMQYAEILMGHKTGGEWEGDYLYLPQDNSVHITRSDFAQRDQGVPSSFLGRWNLGDLPPNVTEQWYLLSPFGMSHFYIDSNTGLVEKADWGDMNFVAIEEISPNQIEVITSDYPVDMTAFFERFGYENLHVAMAMERTGKTYYQGTTEEYLMTLSSYKEFFKAKEDTLYEVHKAEILKRIAETEFWVSIDIKEEGDNEWESFIIRIMEWPNWRSPEETEEAWSQNKLKTINSVVYSVEFHSKIVEPWFAEYMSTVDIDSLGLLFWEDVWGDTPIIPRASNWEMDEWLLNTIGCVRYTSYQKFRFTFEGGNLKFVQLWDTINDINYFTSLADADKFNTIPEWWGGGRDPGGEGEGEGTGGRP